MPATRLHRHLPLRASFVSSAGSRAHRRSCLPRAYRQLGAARCVPSTIFSRIEANRLNQRSFRPPLRTPEIHPGMYLGHRGVYRSAPEMASRPPAMCPRARRMQRRHHVIAWTHRGGTRGRPSVVPRPALRPESPSSSFASPAPSSRSRRKTSSLRPASTRACCRAPRWSGRRGTRECSRCESERRGRAPRR